MKAFEVKVTRYCASPIMAAAYLALAGAMIVVAANYVGLFPFNGNRGPAIESPNLWFVSTPLLSLLWSVVSIALTVVLMSAMNSRFTILKSYSLTFVGVFAIMTAATPSLAVTFTGSSLLAPLMLCSMAMMFMTYQQPRSTRLIYMAFLLPSAGMLCQYAFAIYLPVMLIALAQMRTLSPRAIVAALLAIVTPWWLWWSFSPNPTLTMPEFTFLFEEYSLEEVLPFYLTVGLTLLTGLVCGFLDLMKIFSYNAKARAFNGLLTVVTVMTAVMMLVDFTNLHFYVLLLNACVAFQLGHFFVIYSGRRSYIVMLLLPIAYLGLYLYRLL